MRTTNHNQNILIREGLSLALLCIWLSSLGAAGTPTLPVQQSKERNGEIRVANSPRELTRRDSSNRFMVLGDFGNIRRAAPEDVFGYSLRLWRRQSQIVGLFSVYVGPVADPPTGVLEDVKFNRRTRQLSFRTRLSTGLTYGRGRNGVASRDVFEFNGQVGKRMVAGLFRISNNLFPNDPPKLRRVTLRLSADLTLAMEGGLTYEEWKAETDRILQRLGPKW